MDSASQVLHRALGAPSHARCAALPAGARCWVCGGAAARGMARAGWSGADFVGQNRVRAWASASLCEPCVCATEWATPMTMPVPGAAAVHAANADKRAAAKAAAGKREGKARDLSWRLFSVLVDGGAVTVANKGQKPAILAWLRAPKRGAWFAAVADSGQKHVVPWAPVNPAGLPAGRGAVLFEETRVALGDWALVDDATALLTAGASKEEIGAGEYRPETWARCAAALAAFEARWGAARGGAWMGLALWLAQRDEAAVAERRAAEAAAKTEAKRAGREAKADPGRPRRGRAARAAGGVPAEPAGERAAALGPDDRPRAARGADERRAGRVAVEPAAEPAARGAEPRQLALFGGPRE